MLLMSAMIGEQWRISLISSLMHFKITNFPSDFSSPAESKSISRRSLWCLQHLLQHAVWLYRTSAQTSIFAHSFDHVSPPYTKRIVDSCEILHFHGLQSQILMNLLRDLPDHSYLPLHSSISSMMEVTSLTESFEWDWRVMPALILFILKFLTWLCLVLTLTESLEPSCLLQNQWELRISDFFSKSMLGM